MPALVQDNDSRWRCCSNTSISWQCRRSFGCRSELLALCSFPDDPKGILTAVLWGAFMGIERRVNLRLGTRHADCSRSELGVAGFAYPYDHESRFDEAELTLRHEQLALLLSSIHHILCSGGFDSRYMDNRDATGNGSAVLTGLRFAIGTCQRHRANRENFRNGNDFRHVLSLVLAAVTVDFKRHHYRKRPPVAIRTKSV